MLKFHCGIETFVKIVIFVVHLPFSMLILLMSVMLNIDMKQICRKIAWFLSSGLGASMSHFICRSVKKMSKTVKNMSKTVKKEVSRLLKVSTSVQIYFTGL